MPDYETRLRDRIRNLSKEDALEYLESIEFNVQMKDVWDSDDYEYMDIAVVEGDNVILYEKENTTS